MSYALRFAPQTKKEFKSLDRGVQKFILDSLDELTLNYSDDYENELLKLQRLKKLKGEWSGFYRLRLRSYRVIYEKIEEKLIIHVVRVAHRKDAYQQ
jgi:mRNA interferase RelE/StbE